MTMTSNHDLAINALILNHNAFVLGSYPTAYFALQAALEAACAARSVQLLSVVQRRAIDQQAQLDALAPHDLHSSQSAAQFGTSGMLTMLAQRAQRCVAIMQLV